MSGFFFRKRFLFSLSPKIEKTEKYLALFCLVMTKDNLKNGPIFWVCFFPAWIQIFFQTNKIEGIVLIYPSYIYVSKQRNKMFLLLMLLWLAKVCAVWTGSLYCLQYWNFENKFLTHFCSQLCCFLTNFQNYFFKC